MLEALNLSDQSMSPASPTYTVTPSVEDMHATHLPVFQYTCCSTRLTLPFSTQKHLKTLFVQALLLALHLWPSLPQPLLPDINLLPPGARPPPTGYFTNPDTPKDLAGPAAAAFFAEKHLQKLLPVLRATSSSHPRLHSVWLTILALLLPGFTAVKVGVHRCNACTCLSG